MNPQPVRTGLLAYGMSGRMFHAPFVHAHPGFTFSAVAERSQKKVNAIYPDVKSYDSTDELINDPSLELIIINTPNYSHFEYAKKALEAGKHVLIEKPLATSVAQAKELFELGKKKKRYVMAYQNRRWDSDFQSVKEIIATKKLGKLVEVHLRYDRFKLAIEGKAHKEEPGPGAGLAWNLGPHVLDQAICLFGQPLQVFKTTAAHRSGTKVDDYAFFHLQYQNDLQVYVHVSLLCATPLPAYVLHGKKGSFLRGRTDIQEKQLDKGLSVRDPEYGKDVIVGELTLVDNSGQLNTEYIQAPRGDYYQLFEAVYQQIRHQQLYPITKDEILCQLEILEQKDV